MLLLNTLVSMHVLHIGGVALSRDGGGGGGGGGGGCSRLPLASYASALSK